MACPSIYKPGLFTGRVAIVTGGGSGIGFAIADELLELGARVVIAGRNEEKLAAAVATLIAAAPDTRRGQLLSFRCNIRSEEDVRALMAFVLENFHRIDHLVNNAGGQFPCAAGLMKTKGWRAVIDTNLNGTFLMSREVFTQWMATHPGGSIVNITADFHKGVSHTHTHTHTHYTHITVLSTTILPNTLLLLLVVLTLSRSLSLSLSLTLQFPGMAHTGAARAAVDNLTKTLAVEWAANGVRVNSVAPGLVHSASASANYATQFKANALASMWPLAPAKRIGTVEEVRASTLNFFCLEGSLRAYVRARCCCMLLP